MYPMFLVNLKKPLTGRNTFLSIVIMYACRHNITQDLHEDITLIERVSGFSRQESIEILKNLSNLGSEYKITKSIHGCKEEGNEQEYELLCVNLLSRQPELEYENLTVFLSLMYFGAMSGKCESCSIKTLARLDFSDLNDKVGDDELEAILSYFPKVEDEGDYSEENNNI